MSENSHLNKDNKKEERCQKRRNENSEHLEPVIKKSSFKLQPATLIHGVQKQTSPAETQNTGQSEQNKSQPFIQPPKLQLSSLAAKNNTQDDVGCEKSSEAFTNPFMVCKDTDDEEEEEDTSTKEDSTTKEDVKEKDTKLNAINETKIVFCAANTSAKDSFVFGRNLTDRVKVLTEDNNEKKDSKLLTFDKLSADTTSTTTTATEEPSNKLEENAAACFAATQTKPIAPTVEAFTGEENEKNVLQIQCKLYQFDPKSTQWKERGSGMLHLNDCKVTPNETQFQSRLVMRINGSMRLVLNTKIWSQMSVERPSSKSIRVSAQTENGDIGVYLIAGSLGDIEQVHRAIEYRVLHQKQLEEMNKLKNLNEDKSVEESENIGDVKKENEKTEEDEDKKENNC